VSADGIPVVYDDRYAFEWPGHVFPTEKYRLAAAELVRRGVVPAGGFLRPEPAALDDLLLVHEAAYLERLDAIAAGRAPWVPVDRAVVDAFVLATGGTILAARAAMARGAAANLTGGFHHAYPGHGEGFCLLHDAAVAAKVLRREGLAKRFLFVDLDVHQGNGTIACFEGDADAYTFSIHEEPNYPIPKERGSLDVGLDIGAGDAEYLAALDASLRRIEREFPGPDLLVYVAGADAFERDRLGRLALTREGFRRRDAAVCAFARARALPVLGLLAGGYAERTADVVGIHADMVEAIAGLAR
jgi:acetoin utilization deacetylase AcuC-like enzyme